MGLACAPEDDASTGRATTTGSAGGDVSTGEASTGTPTTGEPPLSLLFAGARRSATSVDGPRVRRAALRHARGPGA